MVKIEKGLEEFVDTVLDNTYVRPKIIDEIFNAKHLQIFVEDPIPMTAGGLARQERSACRDTNGTGGVGPGKVDTVARYLGDRRRHDHLVTCRTREQT